MDESLGRRTATGIIFSRGGCSITFREQNCQDRNIQYCSRLGCSASLYSMKGTRSGEQERASFRSGSSKTFTANSFGKPQHKQRSRKSHHEIDVTESSNSRGSSSSKLKCSSRSLDMNDSDSNREQGKKEKSQSVAASPLIESARLRRFSENATRQLGSCSTKLGLRASNQVTRQPKLRHKANSSTSDNTRMAHRHASYDMASGSGAYGLENTRQTAVSDVILSGFNFDVSGINITDNNLRTRSFRRGSSSSSRGKRSSPSSDGTNSGSSDTGTSGLSLPLPQLLISHQTPRRSRNQSASAGAVSVTRRRPPSADTRIRHLVEVDDPFLVSNPLTVTESQRESGAVFQRSSRLSTEFHPFCQNVNGQPGSGAQIAPCRPIFEPAATGTHIADAPLEARHGHLHLNMERVAEVLLALERIGQDERLTYEQLPSLGNHSYLDSLSFHDQYSDMRMDIDNMSYEELLALEEKIGTVSTALTDEAISRCLKISKYMSASLISGISGDDEGDVKCSICQEEFVIGDELGKLVCEHKYHVTCIHRWLKLKNWCPICKASVSPTS